jgi:hypothetical protein
VHVVFKSCTFKSTIFCFRSVFVCGFSHTFVNVLLADCVSPCPQANGLSTYLVEKEANTELELVLAMLPTFSGLFDLLFLVFSPL